MARLNGGLMSKLKGKLAGVVFQQYEGLNVAKEYQPNVKNPNTDSQVHNRAKFKVVSQRVAVFADVLLLAAGKVSSYIRAIRGALVRVTLPTANFDTEENKAIVDPTSFTNAVNSLNFNPVVGAPVLAGTTIANATISVPLNDTFRYTIVAVNQAGDIVGQATVSGDGAAQPIQIQAPRTTETPTSYEVYAVAMRQATTGSAVNYGNLSNLDSVFVTRGIANGDILVSQVANLFYSQE